MRVLLVGGPLSGVTVVSAGDATELRVGSKLYRILYEVFKKHSFKEGYVLASPFAVILREDLSPCEVCLEDHVMAELEATASWRYLPSRGKEYYCERNKVNEGSEHLRCRNCPSGSI